MSIKKYHENNIVIIELHRPKANAINGEMVIRLLNLINEIKYDNSIQGIILKGNPQFFSAGLDILDLFPKKKSDIVEFWEKFNYLLVELFSYPKLIFSAITGHSPAGGTVIAMMTDYRIMSSGKFKIGLNEVAVGLILPGLIAKVFQYIVGNRKAELYALKGKLINPEEAKKIGLIDDIVDPDHILDETVKEMNSWLKLPNYQQGLTKLKLRADIIEEVNQCQKVYTKEIVDIWFSNEGQKVLSRLFLKLKKI
tara:strand:+ start:340 stop:1098 length:759 start_codon:yes stop_codon:yes gene_type:complete